MIPVCAWCDAYIEVTNRDFPGYCSPPCRDVAQGRLPRRAKATPARDPFDAYAGTSRAGGAHERSTTQ